MNIEEGNYFQARPYKPYHLSIGAVALYKGKVICHYLAKKDHLVDIYSLVRETIRPGETIEIALNRGLKEEFGAQGTIKTYLGSMVANDPWFGEINQETEVEKTTLYFLVEINSFNPAEKEDEGTDIQTHDFAFLIEKMNDQFRRLNINYFNEGVIIERAQLYLQKLVENPKQ